MIIKGPKLFERQSEIVKGILNSDKKIITICTSRQFGKTTLAKTLVLHYALNNKRVKVGYFTPTYRLADDILKDIDGWIGDLNISKINKSTKHIKFNNKSEVKFFSTENPKAIRGQTFDYIVIDEAAFIPEGVFASEISPTFMIRGKQMILISTPLTKENWFYKMCTNPNNAYFWANYMSNPFADRNFIEQMRGSLPQWKFRCEYLGEWVDTGGSIFNNVIELCSLDEQKVIDRTYAGLDIGLKGDYTVLTILSSKREVIRMLRFTNMGAEELINSVVRELYEYRVTVLVAEENFESTIISLIEKAARQTLVVGFRTTNKSKLEIIEDLLVRFDHKHFKHLKNDEVIKEFSNFVRVDLKTTYTYRAESGHDDIVMSAALANHCYNEYYNPNKPKIIEW